MYDTYSVLFKNGMLTAYAENSTTPLFLIIPGPSGRFFIHGSVLMHDSRTQRTQEIYRASTPEDAAALLQAIQTERQERTARQKRLALKLLAVLFVVFCIYMLINIAIYFNDASKNLAMYPPQPPMIHMPVSAPASVSVPSAPKALPLTAPVSADEILTRSVTPVNRNDTLAVRAGNLKRAADSGRYTISLSGGHSRTIYVFSDPLCPHCQEIEPTLEALTRDYNVVIFPVTLVGKQDTVNTVAPILCEAPQKRAQWWRSLFKADGGMPFPSSDTREPQASCTDGEHAISINDRAFDYYQLPGTPQLIADDGRDIPFSALTSDDALARFMNAPIQETEHGNR
ncbi:thioredoxin fold domain-containing protein [Salmonella enterica]|nr:thioredoxin fold domain-containing protein [Salmonella enterica]